MCFELWTGYDFSWFERGRAPASESYGYNHEKVLISVLETLNENRVTVSINITLLFTLSNEVLESRRDDSFRLKKPAAKCKEKKGRSSSGSFPLAVSQAIKLN